MDPGSSLKENFTPVFAGHYSARGPMPDSFKVLSLSPSQLDLVLLVAQFYNQGNRGSDGMSHLPKGHCWRGQG